MILTFLFFPTTHVFTLININNVHIISQKFGFPVRKNLFIFLFEFDIIRLSIRIFTLDIPIIISLRHNSSIITNETFIVSILLLWRLTVQTRLRNTFGRIEGRTILSQSYSVVQVYILIHLYLRLGTISLIVTVLSTIQYFFFKILI
jgi:hypothetical protein